MAEAQGYAEGMNSVIARVSEAVSRAARSPLTHSSLLTHEKEMWKQLAFSVVS